MPIQRRIPGENKYPVSLACYSSEALCLDVGEQQPRLCTLESDTVQTQLHPLQPMQAR